jgi:hypothetical protein
MKYNCELRNEGALPIPILQKVGENLIVGDLTKDRPRYINLQFITTTALGQLEIRCTDQTLVIPLYPDLLIKPIYDPVATNA